MFLGLPHEHVGGTSDKPLRTSAREASGGSAAKTFSPKSHKWACSQANEIALSTWKIFQHGLNKHLLTSSATKSGKQKPVQYVTTHFKKLRSVQCSLALLQELLQNLCSKLNKGPLQYPGFCACTRAIRCNVDSL